MKVLHCPDLVGGNAGQLSHAERELGLESQLTVFQQNYINYPADEILLASSAGILKRELARWKLLWKALPYDVIHYNFGQSIMPSRISTYSKLAMTYPRPILWLLRFYAACFEFFDVRLLKWLGKIIIVTYQGDDARQGDYCRNHFDITFANEVDAEYYTKVSDRLKRERIAAFDMYADHIYALNPDLMHVLPSRTEFLPYTAIDLREWSPLAVDNERPVVLHAPSHRDVKGTRYILDAVSRLRTEGVQFDFILIEGMSNQEARSYYEKADLLIDQLLAGWYGGLSVEMMALGKPVIAYIREQDLGFIPDEMRNDMPIISATPDSLYEVLKHWLTDGKSNLPLLGAQGRRYVEKWHDPLKIAAHMKEVYEGALKEKKAAR